jgi:hypothetical protein
MYKPVAAQEEPQQGATAVGLSFFFGFVLALLTFMAAFAALGLVIAVIVNGKNKFELTERHIRLLWAALNLQYNQSAAAQACCVNLTAVVADLQEQINVLN